MITKELLESRGFIVDETSPESVTDMLMNYPSNSGYLSVRFKHGNKEASGLYAYSGSACNSTRKVVINDSTITEQDLDMAMSLCKL